MKNLTIFVWLFCVSIPMIYAQSEEVLSQEENNPESKKSFFSRLTLGGNMSLSLGNPAFVNLSPLVGYRFSERFQAGLGPSYIYQSAKGSPARNFYGARIYSQCQLVGPLFAWGELEAMNVSRTLPDGGQIRSWQWSPLLGGGLQLKLGGKTRLYAMLLYNVANNKNSWRGTPWVTRIGFSL